MSGSNFSARTFFNELPSLTTKTASAVTDSTVAPICRRSTRVEKRVGEISVTRCARKSPPLLASVDTKVAHIEHYAYLIIGKNAGLFFPQPFKEVVGIQRLALAVNEKDLLCWYGHSLLALVPEPLFHIG